VPHPAEDHLATVLSVLGFRWRHLFDNQLSFASLGSFGVVLPLALLFPERVLGLLRQRLPEAAVLLAVYASLALGTNTDRLLVYAAPVLVPAALRGLRAASADTGWPWGRLALVTLALQLLFWQQTPFHGVLGLSIYQPANLLVSAALLTFWATLRWRAWRGAAVYPIL